MAKKDGAVKFVVFDSNNSVAKEIANCNDALAAKKYTAIAGNGIEDVVFPAFAAVVVGGTSVQGGRGAIGRTVFGILFLEYIRNGFNLLEVDTYWQPVIQGGIILTAVAIDSLSRRA